MSLEAIILSVFVLLSQNRQVARDRVRNDIEYEVNLKSELEIAHLHEKFDHLHAELLDRLATLEKTARGPAARAASADAICPSKMMIVGDPGRFAIQFELDEPVDGEWLFGHFCFRVGGTAVGDWSARASLATGRGLLQTLVSWKGKRRVDRLMAISATEAFAEIEFALFEDDSRSDEAVERDSAFYSRFIAIPTGFDVFDEWMAFLIEDDAKGRLSGRSGRTRSLPKSCFSGRASSTPSSKTVRRRSCARRQDSRILLLGPKR